MDNLEDLLEEDATLAPSADNLTTLSQLVEEQLNLEAEIADLEERLSAKNKALNKISGEEIPALMASCGMQSFVLQSNDPNRTGASVSTKPDISMSLGDTIKPKVVAWLKSNGHGDIVSNEISVKIPKGFDAKKVEAVRSAVLKAGLGYSEAENVNTATVKSLYKDQRERGVALDPKDFGAFHFTKTTIKLPSAKKPRKSSAQGAQ